MTLKKNDTTEIRLNVKLKLEDVIDHEIGVLNIPIFKRGEFCFNMESINDTLDLFVKEMKKFIINKLIQKEEG